MTVPTRMAHQPAMPPIRAKVGSSWRVCDGAVSASTGRLLVMVAFLTNFDARGCDAAGRGRFIGPWHFFWFGVRRANQVHEVIVDAAFARLEPSQHPAALGHSLEERRTDILLLPGADFIAEPA